MRVCLPGVTVQPIITLPVSQLSAGGLAQLCLTGGHVFAATADNLQALVSSMAPPPPSPPAAVPPGLTPSGHSVSYVRQSPRLVWGHYSRQVKRPVAAVLPYVLGFMNAALNDFLGSFILTCAVSTYYLCKRGDIKY